MARIEQILCELQPYIERPPVDPTRLYAQSCSNDGATVSHWAETWVSQIATNQKIYGPFKSRSIGQLFASHKGKPAIIAGSGPSLTFNGKLLAKRNNDTLLLSCLHNFHYFEEHDIPVDYYVTLDAGPITIKEVCEGGSKDEEWYWARTANKTLLAFTGSHPDLLAKWRGDILFFNCCIPDAGVTDRIDEIERFVAYVATGGTVFGAATYIAKAIMGASITAFVGADFAFSYLDKFHGWNSDYDKDLGQYMRVTDIFGHTVKTWRSYHNFKAWFDWLTIRVPGIYINCTEGGTFGAYPEGNIMSVRQMELEHFLAMLDISEHIREQMESPDTAPKKILW